MSKIISNRFDKYKVLFTDKPNDERPRLFLSILLDNAIQNVKNRIAVAGGVEQFTPDDHILLPTRVPEEMTVDRFDNSSPLKIFISDGTNNHPMDRQNVVQSFIHPEWLAFTRDFLRKVLLQPVSEEAKTIIKTIQPDAASLGLNNYVINLIKIMFEIKSAGGDDITLNEASWSSAVGITVSKTSYVRILTMLNYDVLKASVIIKDGSSQDAATWTRKEVASQIGNFKYIIEHNYMLDVDNDDITSTNMFSYKINKFIVQKWLEAYFASKSGVDVVESAFFSEENESASNPDFIRDTKGTLLMVDKDANGRITGTHTKIDKDSLLALSKEDNNNCLTTGVQESGNETCASYLQKCLLNGDISKCKDFLRNHNFWPKALEEVRKINPFVALETLKAFQFETEHHTDSQWGTIVKIEQVQSWLGRLQSMKNSNGVALLTKKEFVDISKNVRLVGYLEMIVQKINNSPAILNRHVNEAVKAVDENPFMGSHFAKLGVKFNPVSTSILSDTQKTIMSTRHKLDRVAISLQLPQLAGLSFPFILRGGSHSKIAVISQRYTEPKTQLWNQINLEYAGLQQRLKASGKEIDANDNKRIEQLINELKVSEKKLYKSILYAEKYADLIEVYGEKDHSTVLSFEHLKQFVDMRNQYFERVTKKQSALTSIIQAVAEAVVKETSKPKQPVQTVGKSKLSLDNFF
jgi:hypothetical protein